MAPWRLSLRVALLSVASGAIVGTLTRSIVEAPNGAAMPPTASLTMPAITPAFAVESAAATVVAGAFEIAWSQPASSERTPSAGIRPFEQSQQGVSIPEKSIESVPVEIAPAHPQTTAGIKADQPPKALMEEKKIPKRGQRTGDRQATTGSRTNADDGRSLAPGSGQWGW